MNRLKSTQIFDIHFVKHCKNGAKTFKKRGLERRGGNAKPTHGTANHIHGNAKAAHACPDTVGGSANEAHGKIYAAHGTEYAKRGNANRTGGQVTRSRNIHIFALDSVFTNKHIL